jgi:hypothetical protein
MATFVVSAPALQGPTTVTNSATQIFNTSGTPISSPASPTLFASGAQLGSVTVTNVGAVRCWVGVSAVSATTGIPLQPGESININGGSHKVGETGATSLNLYAITSSGSTQVEVALATFPSIV